MSKKPTGHSRLPSLRLTQLTLVLSLAAAWFAARQAFAADPPVTSPAAAVLHLTDGNFLSGELKDSTKPGVIRWHATPFVSTFDFPVNAVNAIHWPPPATIAKPSADYCFELAAGDVVFGRLVGLDDKQAELDVPRIGHLHVDRSHLHRIYRWRDSADLIYLGPNGLNGWTETNPTQPNLGNGRVRNVSNSTSCAERTTRPERSRSSTRGERLARRVRSVGDGEGGSGDWR